MHSRAIISTEARVFMGQPRHRDNTEFAASLANGRFKMRGFDFGYMAAVAGGLVHERAGA
jgi:hypothetical protein